MNPPSKRLGTDLFLVLASLAIAFAIWMISKRGDLAIETFVVAAELKNVPPNVQARIEQDRGHAKLSFPVPARERSKIQADFLRVEYDFLKAFPEPRTWCGLDDFRSPPKPIDPQSARIQVVSPDRNLLRRIERYLQSATIDSSQVQVRGKLNTRTARLIFRTKGTLPPGYRLAESIKPVDQGTIPLTAAPDVFRVLTDGDARPVPIETEEIDLSDQRKSFESTVALRLPADVELVYPDDYRRIKAQVLIEEITDTVENVPITFPAPPEGLLLELNPRLAGVSVRAPEEILEKLQPAHFIVRPAREVLPAAGLETSVPLEAALSPSAPSEIADIVAIRFVDPANLTVKYAAPRTEEPVLRSAPFLPEWNNEPD